jgi:hypothetical protein
VLCRQTARPGPWAVDGVGGRAGPQARAGQGAALPLGWLRPHSATATARGSLCRAGLADTWPSALKWRSQPSGEAAQLRDGTQRNVPSAEIAEPPGTPPLTRRYAPQRLCAAAPTPCVGLRGQGAEPGLISGACVTGTLDSRAFRMQ